MQKITPMLWFDNNADEATKFYTKIFPRSKIGKKAYYGKAASKVSGQKEGSLMVVNFTLNGQEFTALNGGPVFTPNPSISFFIRCKTAKEVDRYYKRLIAGGQVMMELGSYPFSKRFAFIKDKFGVSWQIIANPGKSHIIPCLLFVGRSLGDAKGAVKLYTSIFKRSRINSMTLYKKGMPGKPGTVMHCSFNIEGQEFVAMDGEGPHQFAFNEATSFVVNCNTQKEIDYFWERLSKGGNKSVCGWLKDRYGVSWQITPAIIPDMITNKNRKKAEKAHATVMTMKKLDIRKIKEAYDSVK